MNLVKYEAACRALAECKSVDEVKSWSDKAAAMQAYGRMAKDRTLELDASEIRIRAERRLGQLLAAQKADGGLNPKATLKRGPVLVTDEDGEKAPKLSQSGITYDQSSRAQKLAAVPNDEFEAALAEKREREAKEGARVTARLEKRGAEVIRGAIPEPELDASAPSAEELADAESAIRADAQELALLLESDDALRAAADELVRLKAMVRLLTERNLGLVSERDAAVKSAKYWKQRADRSDKAAA